MAQDEQPRQPDHSCRRFFQAEALRLTERLYGTALRLTRNAADAEDLVAEALARAWANLPSLRDPRCFERWVFRTLVNTFLDQRRRRHEELLDDVPACQADAGFSLFEQLHQPFLLWWGDPERELLDKLLREDIEHALDSLPEPFRLVVLMVDVQGFSYAEVAEMLHVPVGTVRSRLSRARASLQRALWRQAGQLGIKAAAARGDVP